MQENNASSCRFSLNLFRRCSPTRVEVSSLKKINIKIRISRNLDSNMHGAYWNTTLDPEPARAARFSRRPNPPMARHHPDLIFCRKQPGVAIGRLCQRCDGRCVVCDSYVRPTTLVRICDECNYGSYQGRCVICGGPGVSDAHYCAECTMSRGWGFLPFDLVLSTKVS